MKKIAKKYFIPYNQCQPLSPATHQEPYSMDGFCDKCRPYKYMPIKIYSPKNDFKHKNLLVGRFGGKL